MANKVFFVIGIAVLLVLLVVLGQRFLAPRFDLPRDGDSEKATVLLHDGEIVDLVQVVDDINPVKGEFTTKEIEITDGVKHSVSLDDVLDGGPPRDGIPSIDDPKFISISEADDVISNDLPGVAVSLDGIDRFYPFDILVWHEIVNDMFNGKRVLVTYCPLCLSGIVFDPVVQGERVEFGTSGKLWNSNLVMYDRKTESLWSQVLGEAIVGDLTGTQLIVLPSDQVLYGKWKAVHPKGEVLSRETGIFKRYGIDPYGDYYTNNNQFIFSTDHTDSRLESKDFVLGIVVNGKAKAYYPPSIKMAGEIEDVFEGIAIIARYESNIDAVRLFEKRDDGTLRRINPFGNFWFSWVAAHPETALYK
ncbi:MAG: hypothetical protein COU08_00025 [Candidatus Harrisonbacteria bacterium CG10_big_fil_rev_8_21_14_0_10_42_17]|uniref:DUF3179 domain-containing protein n=1 Tax=Candidatus Harrisonbacteria bacterium CG10_big_fil_rev_8_21_14_0_10_42_17 TaxID=1974584 RepID=A0A2M6WJ97_9BACT|nr:MAG: hypothetical protein COU08_00025 [Candidatus Harrisonbacteria bacterium CG10_big_fil_rev_8_21_14_0_10_42_17]